MKKDVIIKKLKFYLKTEVEEGRMTVAIYNTLIELISELSDKEAQFQQPITDEMIEKIINDEPELPGIMPDEIWLAAQDKQSLSEVLRLTVRETKNGILNRYKSLSLKAQKDESKTIDHCIILHSGRPLRNRIFTSVDSARNYIKMQYSKRKFSEPEANIFMDKSYGAKFEIVTLNSEA